MLISSQYLPIIVMMGIALALAGVLLGISALLQPKTPDRAEDSIYECGIATITQEAHDRFSVKFFLVAMLFILFDIEAVFLIPWALFFREFIAQGQGLLILVEGLGFLGIVTVGFLYVWRKGALDWR